MPSRKASQVMTILRLLFFCNKKSGRSFPCRILAFGLFHMILVLELFDSAAAGHEFLCPGVERVAGGAYIHTNLFFCGFGFECISAGAGYLAHFIIRMDSSFHFHSPRFNYAMSRLTDSGRKTRSRRLSLGELACLSRFL